MNAQPQSPSELRAILNEYVAEKFETLNVDDVINALSEVKNRKDNLNKQLKDLNVCKDALEKKLYELMATAGISRASNGVATVSIGTEIVFNATDWDTVYAHVQSTGDFSIMHRRLSNAAIREIEAAGGKVPGTEAVEMQKVNFRTL
jgi:ribosomal protein L15